MSDIYAEVVYRAKPLKQEALKPRSWRRWPLRILLLAGFVWLIAEGVSLAIQYTRLNRKLTEHLEVAFGRPVDVGRYAFSIWGGPLLEARSITVAEDPRFGQEYFLRADSMTIRLRWQSLLRGHIELGTLSLMRPSLNLVRNSAGDWNLAEWLPRPADTSAAKVPFGPPLPVSPLRFRKIEIEGGRINFKQGDVKLPLAFVGVTGKFETDGPGRWRMDLEATPWRAAALLQQVGTVHLSGDVGGTSSRLRPAVLNASWTDASVSDVLRLARGEDSGVRGSLALSVSARTQDQSDAWAIQGRAELRQLHRWDLALRPDNPGVNLTARAAWYPGSPEMELTEATLEAPHSNVHATGVIFWDRSQTPPKELSGPPLLLVTSSTIDFADLLEWIRAFRPGVADNISLRGLASVRAHFLPSWPPRVVNAAVLSEGVDLFGTALRTPAHLGQIQFRYDRGVVSLLPVAFSWNAPGRAEDGSFRLDASTKPAASAIPIWHLAGSTGQMRSPIEAAGALGWNISRGWDLSGPFACDLRWQAALSRSSAAPSAQPVGWLEFGTPVNAHGKAPDKSTDGAALRAPFLNFPVEQIHARAELKPGIRHVTLSSAQAFGAHWSGTFDRSDPAGAWQFSLAADRLAAADLDRWMNPAWRETFLDRMLPFLNSPSVAATPENLRATGRLTLDQLVLAPLVVHRLEGDLRIDGRHLELANATGQFYGGQASGSFVADLRAVPSYHANLDFARVDMPALVAATSSLSGISAVSGSAQISFDAKGATRADLMASLKCQGDARVVDPQLVNLDLGKALGSPSRGARFAPFSDGSATFSCAGRKIEFQKLSLGSGVGSRIEGFGSIDFSRNLDLRFQTKAAPVNEPGTVFRLTGSLVAPKVAPNSVSPRTR